MPSNLKPASLTCAIAAAASLLLLAGCDRGAAPQAVTSPAPAAEPSMASSKDFGDYILYFNAIRTDMLTPEVAKTYNITRSANRVLLNVSMVKKAAGTPGVPVPGSVTAQAVNLNGQFKDLTLREIREGDAIYYIGDVPIGSDETLVFTVDATPINETSRFSVRFQREFVGS